MDLGESPVGLILGEGGGGLFVDDGLFAAEEEVVKGTREEAPEGNRVLQIDLLLATLQLPIERGTNPKGSRTLSFL